MPEGDTIFRSATVLRRAIEGSVVERATLAEPIFAVERVIGQKLSRIEARGKHLFMHLASGEAIHSHMGMDGSWHIYPPGEPWRKSPKSAALMLVIRDVEVVCFLPEILEMLTADQIAHHPYLRRLGPDLLAPEVDVPACIARLRVHDAAPIGVAIMNQTIVAGVGNIYKSELLFMRGFDPFAPVRCYSDEDLTTLINDARRHLRRNIGGPRRQTRFAGDGKLLWVYGRQGQACFKCGGEILLRRQGDAGRTTCWCPECQPRRGVSG